MPDTLMRPDVIWRLGNAILLQVLLAGAHHAAHMPDWDCNDRQVTQMGNPDCHIDPLLDQVDDAIHK